MKKIDLDRCVKGFAGYQACVDSVNQKWNLKSLEQDIQLAADCKNNPSGSSCKTNIPVALNYVGDDRKDYAKQSDIADSTKRVLDTALNSGYKAIDDIESRADFFGAMYGYTGQDWFKSAESVSRNDLQGAKWDAGNNLSYFDGNGNYNPRYILNRWREDAGNVIMTDNQNRFQWIYNNRFEPNAVKNWSVYQLQQEQNDSNLQNIHEFYYPHWNLGVQRIANWKAGGSLLNSLDRIRTGCKSMNKPSNCVE